jgi:clan AA aspartic protease (TIGR02281 family)
MDDRLSSAYAAAKANSPDLPRLIAEERAWIVRRNHCPTIDCVSSAYMGRLGELGAPQAHASAQSPPPLRPSGSLEVLLDSEGGVLTVPVIINGAIKLDFVVDSGASDVSIPADVVLTLIRARTITDDDFIGDRVYQTADGRSVPSKVFKIRSLRVGDRVLQDVTASVADISAPLLLGQSFLSRFRSWSIDNERQVLVLQ